MKFVFSVLCFAWILLAGLSANAKDVNLSRQLSKQDSLRYKAYLDSTNHYSLYAYKRQLFLDSALQIAPWNAHLWQQKGMPLFKQKKYELGLPYLDSAVKYNAAEYLEYRAFMKCIFQKSYRASINDFEAARLINGNGGVMDHSYDFYVGLCYLQLDQFDSCEYYMKKCINEQKKALGDSWVHYMNWFYLGVVYYEREDYAKASETFDNCLKLYKNFSDAEYYKAVCLFQLNQKKAALDMMISADSDWKQGYSINEDNMFYETYPYQLNQRSMDGGVKWLEEENKDVKK